MKIILQICAGILLAAAIVSVVYHYAVVVPAERAAAWRAVNEFTTQATARTEETQMKTLEGEIELRSRDPHSPCNLLDNGPEFIECAGIKSTAARKDFVKKAQKMLAGYGTPCAVLSKESVKMCLSLSPGQQVNFAKSAQRQKQ